MAARKRRIRKKVQLDNSDAPGSNIDNVQLKFVEEKYLASDKSVEHIEQVAGIGVFVNSLEYYRDKLPFNPANPETDLVQFAVLYEEIGSRLTRSLSHRDSLKAALKSVEASVAEAAREESDSKLTVAMVDGIVRTNPEYLAAQASCLSAQTDHEHWVVLLEAWRQRGFALRSVVELVTARMRSMGLDSIK